MTSEDNPDVSAAGERIDILMVEDDTALRDMIVAVLRASGYQVVATDTGRKALRLLRSGPLPRLIITDIVMPDEDGLAVARAVREEFAGLPLVAISGHSSHSPLYLRIAGMLGARCTLHKPFKAEELLHTVRQILGGP